LGEGIDRTVTTTPETFTTYGVGGTRIVADRWGDPRTSAVVFLHGGGQTRRSWGRAAAAVAERGWQAITVDLRGHGESDWSKDADYRVTSFAGDVLCGYGPWLALNTCQQRFHRSRLRFGRHRNMVLNPAWWPADGVWATLLSA
jgi:alpha/beta hydrolase family protein